MMLLPRIMIDALTVTLCGETLSHHSKTLSYPGMGSVGAEKLALGSSLSTSNSRHYLHYGMNCVPCEFKFEALMPPHLVPPDVTKFGDKVFKEEIN